MRYIYLESRSLQSQAFAFVEAKHEVHVLNSLPYCMDELQIQAASGQKDFDRVIYKLTEGVGKIRGAKGGGLRQTATWKNCILTTGEDPILTSSSMSGASIRVIEIEAEKPIYSDLVGICGLINQNYGFAGEEFVRYIQSTGVLERIEGIRMGYLLLII